MPATLSVQRDAFELDVKRHRTTDLPDLQVAAHGVHAFALGKDRRAREHDLGVLLHVEKIRRTKVSVTARVAGVDRGHVRADLEAGALRPLRIELDLATELAEPPADRADHHVFDGERHLRVGWVDVPDHVMPLLLTRVRADS